MYLEVNIRRLVAVVCKFAYGVQTITIRTQTQTSWFSLYCIAYQGFIYLYLPPVWIEKHHCSTKGGFVIYAVRLMSVKCKKHRFLDISFNIVVRRLFF
uniref:Uncharacterized protein n=1 Tax=Pararge aegeria TaxID=116150 RepID=S4P3H2_9NEOP